MNVFYLNKDDLWSRDSEGATLLFQPDHGKYFVPQSGSWVEVKRELLSPLQQGFFWYVRDEGDLVSFHGVLPLLSFFPGPLEGLTLKDARGLKATPEELGNSFYLARDEALVFRERVKSFGGVLQEKKEEKKTYLRLIDNLLQEDLLFLKKFQQGDLSGRPAFTERGSEIRDLAEKAMQNGEDLGNRLLLRSQMEVRVEQKGKRDEDVEFLILLELLHDAVDNTTLDEEGLWLHFPESDIFLGRDRRIFLRGK